MMEENYFFISAIIWALSEKKLRSIRKFNKAAEYKIDF